MKISLNWLTDYVDVTMSAAELAELFMRLGFCCDGIEETPTDIVLDLEITSNRPDLLGHLGVARELSAATSLPFKPPVVGELPARGRVEDLAAVEVLDADLCPRYTARVIRNVKVGESPRWMVERLEAAGLRSINNIVDVTNYVLMEYSQPLHSFDLDKLAGGKIVVRRARAGELLVSIDETQCRLDEEMLVIADAEKPVAIAGIMGGLNTEVTERTTNVLIESAQFDPLTTRRTSRKLALMSESNYRFERGVDPVGLNEASLRACALIIELAGGEPAEGVIDVWAKPFQPTEVSLRPERTCGLLGIDIPAEQQEKHLAGLGLNTRREDGRIVCTIPSHRGDLKREADLIEEVARLESYDRIPTSGTITHAVQPGGLAERTRRRLRDALCSAGFDEAVTPVFLDAGEAERFGHAQSVCVDTLTRRTNNVLRPVLLPSLLRVCKTNQDAGCGDVDLFELANVFGDGGEGLPEQHVELAMVTTRSLRDLRGSAEAVAAIVAQHARIEVRPADLPGLARGTSGELLIDGGTVGRIGCLDETVRDAYGLERTIHAATLRFDALLDRAGEVRTFSPVGRFPPVRRDLSLIVDEPVTWREISDAVTVADQPMRAAVEYVTTYRGSPVPAGRKSVTLTLTYRSESGTLRGEDVDEQVEEVLAVLRENLAAELRK